MRKKNKEISIFKVTLKEPAVTVLILTSIMLFFCFETLFSLYVFK